MHLKLILVFGSISQILSIPVTPATTQCSAPCEWTQWFNVNHPSDRVDGGDWETLSNIQAHGYKVCSVPRDIRCRSTRFPFVPYSDLLYKAKCDPSIGLICLNKDNEAKCVDFEVQLLCCPCDEVPDSSTQATTTVSTPSSCTPTCQWTQWFNVDHPTNNENEGDWETLANIRAHGYNVCQAPKDIHCRSALFPNVPFSKLLYNAECDASTGLICLNKNNVNTCVDFEVQFLCCTCEESTPLLQTTQTPALITENPETQCENPKCSWTPWLNTHRPSAGMDGGDSENITTIRQSGYPVCNYPKAVSCRLERFPYIPLQELYSVQECSTSHGLVCLNKDQQDNRCQDYEVQFLCCTCDATTPVQKLEKTV